MNTTAIKQVNVESLLTELQTTGQARLSDHATPVQPTEQSESEQDEQPATEQPQLPALRMLEYSEKAFAIVGDTKAHRAQLKKLGGRFNPKLKCGAGWIFSKKRGKEVATALGFTA